MGTRSTYRIISIRKDENEQQIDNNEICLIYMQYDGYPEGHPSTTAEWLSKARITNGFGANETDLIFNGAGCLAARLVGKLKEDKHGNCYMYSLKDRGNCGEDYMYDIVVDETNKSIEMIAYDSNNTIIFKGSPKEFVASKSISYL
jgi:hypothetical protein